MANPHDFNHSCDRCAGPMDPWEVPADCIEADRAARQAWWAAEALEDREAVRMVQEDVMSHFDPLFHGHLRDALRRVLSLSASQVSLHTRFGEGRYR